jgi:hypothetical protein
MKATRPMKRITTVAATRRRRNRLLIALAAAWMILTLAIGGAVTADSRADASRTTLETVTVVGR